MSIRIIYKEKEEYLFWKYWQELVASIKPSPRYLPLSMETRFVISKSRSLFYKDKSFVYLVNGRPLACVFLPIEQKDNYFTISLNQGYVGESIFNEQLAGKKVFSIIDDIAKNNKVVKIMFALDPLDSTINYNYLQKYDYLDTSILTYIINLSQQDRKEDLLKACRRGHKCDIKKMLRDKDFKVFFIDKDNPKQNIHEEYVALHNKCAGKVTRPKKTFDFQFEELKNGQAVLAGLKYKEKTIAYSYFVYSGDKAIYASSSDDPDYDKFHLYHILIFSAMEYFKKIGIRYIDVSQPSSPSAQTDYYPDKKQLNIALFKRGFGGDYKNYYRGIKYFSKTLLKQDIKTFLKNYNL